MRIYTEVDSEIGKLYIVAENNRVSAIYIGQMDFLAKENISLLTEEPENEFLRECVTQLKEYFGGLRTAFTLLLEQKGTDFQVDIWNKLAEIPFGQTKSYQDIAIAVGRPKAVRAVGQANKANRIPIIIPCHRVIGKNQTLTGYAGSRKDIKKVLLTIEGASFIGERN